MSEEGRSRHVVASGCSGLSLGRPPARSRCNGGRARTGAGGGGGDYSRTEASRGSRMMMSSAPRMSKEKPERIILVIGTVPDP